MQVGVDIEVVLLEITAHHLLVLLPVASTDDEVILRADEPDKLFKPVLLARLGYTKAHAGLFQCLCRALFGIL